MNDELRAVLATSYVRRIASGQIPSVIVWRCPISNAVLQRAEAITTFPHSHHCKWCELEHIFSAKNIHVEPYDTSEIETAFIAGAVAELDSKADHEGEREYFVGAYNPHGRLWGRAAAAKAYASIVKETT